MGPLPHSGGKRVVGRKQVVGFRNAEDKINKRLLPKFNL
jgi:hypothetical protein